MKTMSRILTVLAAASMLAAVGCGHSQVTALPEARTPLSGDMNLVHDVGSVLEGTKVEHVFHIENEFLTALAIAEDGGIEKTCGCTTLDVSPRRLEPGEKAEIRLRVDTAGKSGRFRAGGLIRWRTENSKSQQVNVSLEGLAKNLLDSQPGLVQFSADDVAQGRSKELLVFNSFDVDWATLNVNIDPPNAEILETTIQDDHVKLLLRARPSSEHTDFAATLRLTAELKQAVGDVTNCAIAVPVHGTQRIDLQVSPHVLFATWSPESNQGNARFLLRGPAPNLTASISSITCDGLRAAWTATEFASLNQLSSSTLQVELSLTEPEDPFELHQARRVRIDFVGGRSLEVPVYLVARPVRS